MLSVERSCNGFGFGRLSKIRDVSRAARRQTLVEYSLLYGNPVIIEYCEWRSEEDDDDDDAPGDALNDSRLPHEHELLVIRFEEFNVFEGSFGSLLPASAAVRSQCFLINIGISEKARKRCVFICALNSLIRAIECIVLAVRVSDMSPHSIGC